MQSGVKVNKLNGGLGRSNPSTDNVIALVCVVALAALPAGVAHYQPTQLLQPRDAVAIGFDAAWDANRHKLVNYSVNEIFRLAPDAVVHLIPVPDALSPLAILQAASFKTALRSVPDVKGFGILGTTETVTALYGMVDNIQVEINALATQHRLIDFVILEGIGVVGPMAVADYPDFRLKAAANVSVTIAQDPYIASLDAAYAKRADVGAVLGMLAARKVNENAGSVDIINKPGVKKGDRDYPLTEGNRWAGANLSDGSSATNLTDADCKSLTAKGYIFATGYESYAGIFLNGSPTCVAAASDYAYIENNRVWNKAARAVREALMPYVKGVVKKDPATGYILSTTVTRYENLAKAALEKMAIADEISGYAVSIDPKQVLSATSPLRIKAQVVMDDIAHEFEVDLGLAAKI